MEKRCEDLFFLILLFFKEDPKGSEGGDLFNKNKEAQAAHKQDGRGDIGECDVPGRLLQARIITTNRSNLHRPWSPS